MISCQNCWDKKYHDCRICPNRPDLYINRDIPKSTNKMELQRKNAELLESLKAAIAALSQNKIFPADIKAAKKFLNNAIAKAE